MNKKTHPFGGQVSGDLTNGENIKYCESCRIHGHIVTLSYITVSRVISHTDSSQFAHLHRPLIGFTQDVIGLEDKARRALGTETLLRTGTRLKGNNQAREVRTSVKNGVSGFSLPQESELKAILLRTYT